MQLIGAPVKAYGTVSDSKQERGQVHLQPFEFLQERGQVQLRPFEFREKVSGTF